MIFVCFMLIPQQQQHSTIKCTQITLSPQQQTNSVNNTTSLVACFYICNKSKGIEVTKIVKVINPDHWHQFIKGSLPKGRVKIILHYWFNQEQYCSMIKDIYSWSGWVSNPRIVDSFLVMQLSHFRNRKSWSNVREWGWWCGLCSVLSIVLLLL